MLRVCSELHHQILSDGQDCLVLIHILLEHSLVEAMGSVAILAQDMQEFYPQNYFPNGSMDGCCSGHGWSHALERQRT